MPRDSSEQEFLLSELSASNRPDGESKGDGSAGRRRAYWLGAVICMGGFLHGYDTGIVGGVLMLQSFMRDYGYAKGNETRTNSLAVALQQAGAFVACFLIWPVTHRLGRRKALIICSVVFCVGAMIQTINTGSLTMFFIARVIAGLGLGGATVVIPMYSSEMAPKELRGQVGCFFQLFFTFGIFSSYWCDYGVSELLSSNSYQWQIPIGLQLIPGALLGIGVLTLKESVRWYVKRGQHEKAWESLKWVRASSSQKVREELEEIRVGVEMELKETQGFRCKELLEHKNFHLVFTAFNIFMAQQATGATAFAYYAPQYFKLLVGSGSKDLLLTGIFGFVKVGSCATFVWFLSERIGRKTSLVWGAAAMSICHFIAAGVVRQNPPPDTADPEVSASGITTVLLIYLFVSIYNMTWGPLPWPYVSEIFPTRIREPGVAVGVSSQWLFNFIFTLTTPYMIESLGWGTFLLWGIFNVVIAAVSYSCIRETKGMSLEEINAEFQGKSDALHKKVRRSSSHGTDGNGIAGYAHSREGYGRSDSTGWKVDSQGDFTPRPRSHERV